jgi:hypothetical protein
MITIIIMTMTAFAMTITTIATTIITMIATTTHKSPKEKSTWSR